MKHAKVYSTYHNWLYWREMPLLPEIRSDAKKARLFDELEPQFDEMVDIIMGDRDPEAKIDALTQAMEKF